jgi:hypothetical protein
MLGSAPEGAMNKAPNVTTTTTGVAAQVPVKPESTDGMCWRECVVTAEVPPDRGGSELVELRLVSRKIQFVSSNIGCNQENTRQIRPRSRVVCGPGAGDAVGRVGWAGEACGPTYSGGRRSGRQRGPLCGNAGGL